MNVESINIPQKSLATDLHFSVNRPTGKVQVTVSEKSSGKVIREIPSSESLQIAAKMDEMVGMIFDKKF